MSNSPWFYKLGMSQLSFVFEKQSLALTGSLVLRVLALEAITSRNFEINDQGHLPKGQQPDFKKH